MSEPVIFLAMVAIFVFSLTLGWFPVAGARTPAVPPTLGDHLRHLILPALVLAVVIMGDIMRYARASMLFGMRFLEYGRIEGGTGKPFFENRGADRDAVGSVLSIEVKFISHEPAASVVAKPCATASKTVAPSMGVPPDSLTVPESVSSERGSA